MVNNIESDGSCCVCCCLEKEPLCVPSSVDVVLKHEVVFLTKVIRRMLCWQLCLIRVGFCVFCFGVRHFHWRLFVNCNCEVARLESGLKLERVRTEDGLVRACSHKLFDIPIDYVSNADNVSDRIAAKVVSAHLQREPGVVQRTVN